MLQWRSGERRSSATWLPGRRFEWKGRSKHRLSPSLSHSHAMLASISTLCARPQHQKGGTNKITKRFRAANHKIRYDVSFRPYDSRAITMLKWPLTLKILYWHRGVLPSQNLVKPPHSIDLWCLFQRGNNSWMPEGELLQLQSNGFRFHIDTKERYWASNRYVSPIGWNFREHNQT